MNQGEDILKNYTVAKAMEPVTWGDDTEKIIDVIYVGGQEIRTLDINIQGSIYLTTNQLLVSSLLEMWE